MNTPTLLTIAIALPVATALACGGALALFVRFSEPQATKPTMRSQSGLSGHGRRLRCNFACAGLLTGLRTAASRPLINVSRRARFTLLPPRQHALPLLPRLIASGAVERIA